MEGIKELLTLNRDLGPGLILIGAVFLIPLVVTAVFQEWAVIPWILIPAVVFLSIGFIFRYLIPKNDDRPSSGLSIAATALLWVVVSLVCGIPFLYVGITYTDAIFESMSALTGTGFSVLVDLESYPHTLLFWRSFMQWLGGLGIVAFTLAVANKTGLVARGLYRSEGRSEAFMPSVIATAIHMWKIYLVLTIIAFGLILLTGVGVWDAVNLSLCAISTGGMCLYSDGIAHYGNVALELVLIPIMFAGAIPFRLYFLTLSRHSIKEIFSDKILQLIISVFVIVVVLLLFELLLSGMSIQESVSQALFMAGAAVSSAGFQNTTLAGWGFAPMMILALFCFIGGPQGSTAGGVKLDRIHVMLEAVVWWFKKSILSLRAVLPMKHEGRMMKSDDSMKLISNSLLLIILYVLMVIGTLLILMHDPYFAANPPATIFDVFSCVGNNGCTAGMIGPNMPEYANLIIFFVMWVARLGIIPVMILLWGVVRGFSWESVMKKD